MGDRILQISYSSNNNGPKRNIFDKLLVKNVVTRITFLNVNVNNDVLWKIFYLPELIKYDDLPYYMISVLFLRF